MLEKTDGSTTAINAVLKPAETTEKTLFNPETTLLNPAETGGATKIGDLNYAASTVKALLNKKLDIAANVSPASAEKPSLSETLQKIEDLPKPTRKGIPSFFPEEIREEIYEKQVRKYNNQRARLAEYAIAYAEPPKLKDFASPNTPPKLAQLDYQDARNAHYQYLGELKQIYREAKTDNLELNPQYRKLPAETKQLLNNVLIKNQDSLYDVSILTGLAKATGFNQLEISEQKQFLNYVGGTNEEISSRARASLPSFLNDPATDKTDPETFRQFLKDQPHLDEIHDIAESVSPSGIGNTYNPARRPYQISGPENVSDYDFHSGKADALKYEVEINGKTFPVYMHRGLETGKAYFHSIDEVAKGLAGLPEESFNAVQTVSVDPRRNPDDAYWAKEYGDPNFRAYMSAGADGNINIYPTDTKQSQQSLDESFIHESGHIISDEELFPPLPGIFKKGFANIPGPFADRINWDDWAEAINDDVISPSDYAEKSIKEDFSDTLVLYLKYKETPQEAEFRALMPERFALMDQILAE